MFMRVHLAGQHHVMPPPVSEPDVLHGPQLFIAALLRAVVIVFCRLLLCQNSPGRLHRWRAAGICVAQGYDAALLKAGGKLETAKGTWGDAQMAEVTH